MQMAMDPIELRLRNEPEKDPTTGTPFSSRHIVEAYQAGAERFGWSRRHAAAAPCGAKANGGSAWACATATYPYYRMPGGAARITLTKHAGDGQVRVKVEIAAHEMGMGTATAQTQVTAERLGLPMERVQVCYGDSRFPGFVLAGGSQQTASIGMRGRWRRRAKARSPSCSKHAGEASPLHGLKADEVEGRDGGARARSTSRRGFESYAALLARADRQGRAESSRRSAPPPLETRALVDAFVRRHVLRGAGQRRHRRAARHAAFSARSTAAASSTPKTADEPVPRRHHHGPRPRRSWKKRNSTSAAAAL